MTNDPLASLQAGFQDYILGTCDRALAQIESTPTLSAERRLDIYHNAYRVRLAELLADTYERVVLYIGDDSFDSAARAYIEGHPPTSRNLRNYGNAFPAFLADFFPDDREVAELAAMDGRLRNTFDAADAGILQASDLATLQGQDWDSVVFALHPTASFLTFRWNTPAIWQSLNEGIAPPPAELLPQPVAWLFWRMDLQPHFRSLASEEQAALRAISKGQAFGTLCAELAQRHPDLDIAMQIAQWLRTWLGDGVLRARAS
jgi:hypothetical protein